MKKFIMLPGFLLAAPGGTVLLGRKRRGVVTDHAVYSFSR